MPVYYAAVEDDPLTSGKGSRVFASVQSGTVLGEDGRHRRLVYIGDDAYCPACNSNGSITYGVPLSENRRLLDLVNGGRRQAVGGDIVLCKCAQPPRIIAMHGLKWRIVDGGKTDKQDAGTSVASAAPSPPSQPAEPQYERWFYIWNSATGEAMPNRDFIALVNGARQTGRTDRDGYTRIMTDGEQSVEIHVTFNAPKRKLNPTGA